MSDNTHLPKVLFLETIFLKLKKKKQPEDALSGIT